MIKLTDVTRIYNMAGGVSVTALNHVNLSVEKGEFLAIMGASGSGKSTLLHLIGGIDVPTSGTVEINHENIHKMKPSERAIFRRRKVGIIFQAYNLIPTLTVEENMILPLLLDKRKPKQDDVEKILRLLKLEERRRHFPGQLSGGQQQRTAIGRILLEKPEVLLADEPTGNLDSENSRDILRYLKAINDEGQTIIMVTHDAEIGKTAKRLLQMKDGRIVSDSNSGKGQD